MHIESLSFAGVYTVDYGDGRVEEFHNVVTEGFMQAIFKLMDYTASTPSAESLNLTHMALGEGTASAKRSDVKLEDEYFRKPLSYKGFSNVFNCECLISPSEGNPDDTIKELAIFANATGDKDSGLMISRANVGIIKTSSLSITITWRLERL